VILQNAVYTQDNIDYLQQNIPCQVRFQTLVALGLLSGAFLHISISKESTTKYLLLHSTEQ